MRFSLCLKWTEVETKLKLSHFFLTIVTIPKDHSQYKTSISRHHSRFKTSKLFNARRKAIVKI